MCTVLCMPSNVPKLVQGLYSVSVIMVNVEGVSDQTGVRLGSHAASMVNVQQSLSFIPPSLTEIMKFTCPCQERGFRHNV